MILTFASSKGGVGKSTTCACLGAALALQGERVLIIDLDQNRTLHRWSQKADIPQLSVDAIAGHEFVEYFREKQAAGAFDHILIDLAGTREITLLKALARSDLVIIPTQQSEPDLKEALVIIKDLRDLAETNGGRRIPYRILFTKVFPLRTRVGEFIDKEVERLKLQHFETGLVDRSSYKELFLNGQPPTITEPNKGAGLEIANLLAEIVALTTANVETLKAAS